MKNSRFTAKQVTFALKQAEAGATVEEECRKMVSQATFYTWRKKYGDLGVSQLRPLRQLDIAMLQDVRAKSSKARPA